MPGRPAAPTRGSSQAHRHGQVRRRPRRAGRLVRGHDPLDRRARPLPRARPRPGLRLVVGRGRDRGRHPRREHRQLDQGGPADPRADRRRDPAPRRAAGAARRRRTAATLRAARRAVTRRTEPLPPVFDPLESRSTSSRPTSIERGEVEAAIRRRRPRPRGRVPGRPPGAALHREQRDDRGPARGRRRDRPRLAPVPVLRPHRAQARPRRSTTGRPGSIQAETGGGFGGKEEFPSVIALHAALLARQGPAAGPDDLRPPRGHRGDDQAPPGDRPPPDRRDPRRPARRPGHRGRDGRRRVLHAHAGRPVARRAPRRRPVPLPERPDPGPRDARRTRRPTGRSAASGRRRPSSRPRPTSTGSPSALGISPLEIRRRNVYRLGDTTPTGQVLRESVAGEEVLERAAEAAEFERLRERTGRERGGGRARARSRARRCGRSATRIASGIGLALAWHGAGLHRVGRGQARLGRLARADRRGPDPDPHRVDRDGPGDQDDLPAARRRGARRAVRRGRDRAAGHGLRPRLAARPSRRARRWSSAACSSRPPGGCAQRSRRRPAAVRATSTATTRRDARRRSASTSASSRIPGVSFDDETYRGDAYPAFGWAACVARVDVDLDTGEVHVRDVVAADDIGRGHPPGPRRGPGRGRHAPGRRLRHDRGDQAARRPLPQRPPRDLHHPDLARRAADLDDPRRGAVRAARRTAPRGSASCRWTSGRRRSWPRSPTRPASGSRDLPASPERILAALAGRPDVAPLPPGRLGAGPPHDDVPVHASTAPRSRSTSRACAACSTSCARTSP